MEKIYKKSELKRTYFSAFTPIQETEFSNKESCSTDRTSKLYNADSLLNDYHYDVKELVFDDNDNLLLTQDPKILAAENINIFPCRFCFSYNLFNRVRNRRVLLFCHFRSANAGTDN